MTRSTPKPLLDVGGATLLDQALERLAAVTDSVAVNAHYLAQQIVDHVGERAQLFVEAELLGTAGALGNMKDWIAGRAVAVTNADAWLCPNPFPELLRGWDGTAVRLAVVDDEGRADFGDRWRYAGSCLLPAASVLDLEAVPSGLYEICWAPGLVDHTVELVPYAGEFFDCGTPDELRAARASASALRSGRPSG